MTPLKKRLMRGALDTLYRTSAYRLLQAKWQGVGVIFTLHHIRPDVDQAQFAPNRILDITPEFLDQTLSQVKRMGFDIIDLDEAYHRLMEQRFDQPFVVFTIDDGYLDNLTEALPVFQKHQAPFTVYVCTGFPDGQVFMWWEVLERIVRDHDEVSVTVNDQAFEFTTISTDEKYTAFNQIYWALRKLPHVEQYAEAMKISDQYAFDWQELVRECSMNWDQIRQLQSDPLVTIGAHTIHHYALRKLTLDQVRDEAKRGREILIDQLGEKPKHFAYPYGDAGSAARREFEIMQELGFTTSTTTRKGVIFPEHRDHLHALPRVSLNGDYQHERYIELFLSGAPFAISNKFKRLVVS